MHNGKKWRTRVTTGVLGALCFWSAALMADEIRTLEWDDLIPDSAKKALVESKTVDHSGTGSLAQVEASAPINPALDKQRVKIAGFAVPLEGDEKGIREFLLVPYMGACVHVPPPPSNQIIYVVADKPISPDFIYDPFWVTGKITVTAVSSELAEAGYSMIAEGVEAYEY
jgi:hypothetical protein